MALLQPALPHHGMGNARLGVDRAGHGIGQRAGTCITLKGSCAHHLAVGHLNIEDAPVVAGVVAIGLGGGHGWLLKVWSDSKPVLPTNNNRARGASRALLQSRSMTHPSILAKGMSAGQWGCYLDAQLRLEFAHCLLLVAELADGLVLFTGLEATVGAM